LSIYAEGHVRQQLTLAWYIAGLSRAKKLPTLNRLLKGEQEKQDDIRNMKDNWHKIAEAAERGRR
jgi:hypothetical protein